MQLPREPCLHGRALQPGKVNAVLPHYAAVGPEGLQPPAQKPGGQKLLGSESEPHRPRILRWDFG